MSRLRALFVLLAAGLVAGAALLTGGGSPAAGAPAAATEQVVVRPVTSAGAPAAGWTVSRGPGPVDCDGAAPSAVDPGIASCYPTAAGVRACWKSGGHTLLCVSDARSRTLVRVGYTGTFPNGLKPRTRPMPMNLQLLTGPGCLARNGGAWGAPSGHANWVGFYSCTQKQTVYAPPSSRDGVNRTTTPWTVKTQRTGQDTIVRRAVRVAWYVGTAA